MTEEPDGIALSVETAESANQLLKTHRVLECLEEGIKYCTVKCVNALFLRAKTSRALALLPEKPSLLFSVTSL